MPHGGLIERVGALLRITAVYVMCEGEEVKQRRTALFCVLQGMPAHCRACIVKPRQQAPIKREQQALIRHRQRALMRSPAARHEDLAHAARVRAQQLEPRLRWALVWGGG